MNAMDRMAKKKMLEKRLERLGETLRERKLRYEGNRKFGPRTRQGICWGALAGMCDVLLSGIGEGIHVDWKVMEDRMYERKTDFILAIDPFIVMSRIPDDVKNDLNIEYENMIMAENWLKRYHAEKL